MYTCASDGLSVITVKKNPQTNVIKMFLKRKFNLKSRQIKFSVLERLYVHFHVTSTIDLKNHWY